MHTALVAALVSLLALRASAIPQLKVTLLPSGSNPLSIKSTLTNTGSETVKLLNDPRTVLSEAATETFLIASSNGSPDFIGIRAKYSPDYVIEKNDPASFIVLAPGQSLEVTHDISRVYDFTGTRAGEYKIEAVDTFNYVDQAGRLASVKATTKPSVLKLTESLIPTGKPGSPSRRLWSRQSGRRFNQCSESQKKDITQAITDAETYVTEVLLFFNTHDAETERYSTWFGEFDSNRFHHAKDHFAKIQHKSWNTLYDCSCNMVNVYAYVYPDQPGEIHLCPAFWEAPAMGTDSKAGTLIHEQSHFTVNGGTRDYTYGQAQCRDLAKGDPYKAVNNADNHEFFAENPPQ